MRPNIQISYDGNEFFIKLWNVFEKGGFHFLTFEEPQPTEHNIKLHINRLFDILRDKAPTEKQKTKIDRFFSEVRNRAGLLDGLNYEKTTNAGG